MAAMKTEPFGMLEDDQILKMEVHVLKKLSKSNHACKIYAAGKVKIPKFSKLRYHSSEEEFALYCHFDITPFLI